MSVSSVLRQYAVLVPVKPPAVGKSRLAGLDAPARRALAEAFAQDTVLACLRAERVAQVLVVTDDARFSQVLSSLGCAAIPDGVAGDLNGTLRQAAAEAHRRWPDLAPVALCADLPALRPADLDLVLSGLPSDRPSFVPDAIGIGTTLYAAPAAAFDPHFGPGSRAAHIAAGAHEVSDAPASVRRDVDDQDDLADAKDLGLGASTSVAVIATEGA
ncbi:2-phospho-L-lactate guanylyltransferase [Nocardioides sp. MAH-18]|uniref:2-phospho-L-lactate guanylyltransferase n=1 Tax=Nocardioides agri TaxID=2682843 RepID=A0A6L6XMD3_9ACTN|nr:MULTISPECIES: 2-phospho-L-lactate guanylyltransferase [unclassified Nocardioides]MBA2953497.1 2-phospho-L-lactate guanylyltransferase [Nocardioides sp. CGMCC 1.13656]MVQ48364.1 2-phospho-L-lactate guanylyltransferase [Nocardioides sp. MAH-18]